MRPTGFLPKSGTARTAGNVTVSVGSGGNAPACRVATVAAGMAQVVGGASAAGRTVLGTDIVLAKSAAVGGDKPMTVRVCYSLHRVMA